MSEPPQLATILKGERVEHFDVRFFDCKWGWIHFVVEPLAPEWTARCTNIVDPFPGMIAWLEAILAGASVARWSIANEGASDHFVFLSGGGLLHGGSAVLLQACSSSEVWRLAACTTSVEAVVRSFYTAFRRFVEGPDYAPEHWEPSLGPSEIGHFLTSEWEDEDGSRRGFNTYGDLEPRGWDGEYLKLLRSERIEAWLRGDEQRQLKLAFGPPYDRRVS